MPEPCLAFVYLHLDIFKIIIRCKCTAYYSKFYSVIEENIYHRILEASNNYEKGICRLLSKAYVASLFEIIYCNYDFETARKCISAMERFFVPQGISCYEVTMKLYASGEDYLEAILVLQQKQGMVRSVDVARHMDVSKPSVCHAVATLRNGGFLTMDEDHFLHLTDIGREVATSIYERHCFFTEQLIAAGVDPKTAEADACRMEHVISTESFLRLKEATEQEFK